MSHPLCRSLDAFLRDVWSKATRYGALIEHMPIRLSRFATGRRVGYLARMLEAAGFRIIKGEISDGFLRLGNGGVYAVAPFSHVVGFGDFRVFRNYVYEAVRSAGYSLPCNVASHGEVRPVAQAGGGRHGGGDEEVGRRHF